MTRVVNSVAKNAKVSKGLRKQSKELDLSGLKFPVELDRIRILEKKNNQLVWMCLDMQKLYPLRISKEKQEKLIFWSQKMKKKTFLLNKKVE